MVRFCRRYRFGLTLVCIVFLIIDATIQTISAAPFLVGISTSPLNVESRATLNSIGIKWLIEGDDNQNATATVLFRRQGTSQWREALPLFRVAYEDINLLAGSIFHLAPGTTYEIRLDLTDPEGGNATRTISVTTRMLPGLPDGGNVVDVYPGQLASVQAQVQPGDILLLHGGNHGSGIELRTSGQPNAYIVYMAAGDGVPIINGEVKIAASYIWLDGITIEGSGIAGQRSYNSKGVVVTRCTVRNAHYAVSAYGEDWIVSDNLLIGDKQVDHDDPMGGEGVEFGGRGHVASYNDISWVADNLSYGNSDIDFFNNIVHHSTDDFFEPDYAYDNYRIWRNRAYAGHNGLSFQPIHGGPWYFFQNQITGTTTHTFKLRSGTGPRLLANNTLISSGYTMNVTQLWDGIWSNNVWAQLPNGQLGYSSEVLDPARVGVMDYNAYSTGGSHLFKFATTQHRLQDMQNLGLELNSFMINAGEELLNLPSDSNNGTERAVLPKVNSQMIDTGMGLPNILGPYFGQAPDVGAYERGLGLPWVGPRSYTSEGLVYGLPTGWRTVSLSEISNYQDLGAPNSVSDGKLLLVRDNPRAFLLVTFEAMTGEARWNRFDDLIENVPVSGSDVLEKSVYFLDSLGGRIWHRTIDGNPAATLIAGEVIPDGVLNVLGGTAEEDLEGIHDEMFTFLRSLAMTFSLNPQAPSSPQTFVDVPPNHWAYDYIETLYQDGYVAGCNTDPLMYCPDQAVTRAESAVFVERGIHGADYLPLQTTEQVFADVPDWEWFFKWTTALWNDDYTAGCGTDPLIYCPLQGHTRAEGCVFFLRMLNGTDYVPPDPEGIFADVSLDDWGAKWIEAAYNAGLIPACAMDPELRFCPDDPLDRAMGAYMMVQAKGLAVP